MITKISTEGKISQGKYEGHNIIIPWIPLTLKFSFSSINKSQACQDQALEVDLTNESFTHRMLYVALTRGGSPDSLTLYSREGLLTRVMLSILKFQLSLSAALVFLAYGSAQ